MNTHEKESYLKKNSASSKAVKEKHSQLSKINSVGRTHWKDRITLD